MEKLMKRKEELEKVEQRKREKRRLDRIKKEQEKKAKKAEEDLIDSSDSESLSGGDDDIQVTVDPKLVENLQKALKDEVLAITRTSENPTSVDNSTHDLDETEIQSLPQPPGKAVPIIAATTKPNTNKPAPAQAKQVPANKVNASDNKLKVQTKASIPLKPTKTANTTAAQQQTPKARAPSITGRTSRSVSEDKTSSVPVTPTTIISDDAKQEEKEIVEVASGGFQNKNMAALLMIRKMKEERVSLNTFMYRYLLINFVCLLFVIQ